MSMVYYGITERLDFTAMLPYIRTSSTGGQLTGVCGFQDLPSFVKGLAYQKGFGNQSLKVNGVGGFFTPITNYLSYYMLYSLGLGCREFSLRLTSKVNFNPTYNARLSVTLHWRGYREIERDYYYQDGSVYSTFMDVANAYGIHGGLGGLWLGGRLRSEVIYWSVKCYTGDDRCSWVRPQPPIRLCLINWGCLFNIILKDFIS